MNCSILYLSILKLEVHNNNIKTRNQRRIEIIRNISKTLNKKGIWVFDRGNDDKQFFKDLRHNLDIKFICRLKRNRQVVIKKTGEKIKVENLSEGKYEIYLMNRNNYKVNIRSTYTLIIHQHRKVLHLLSI